MAHVAWTHPLTLLKIPATFRYSTGRDILRARARSAQPNCAAQRRQVAPQAPLGGAQRRRRRQAQTRRLRAPLSPLFCTTFHFPRSSRPIRRLFQHLWSPVCC